MKEQEYGEAVQHYTMAKTVLGRYKTMTGFIVSSNKIGSFLL